MFKTSKEIFAITAGSLIVIVISVKVEYIDISISFGLLGLLGFFLAFHKYSYEREKDKESKIVDLITFFRNDVLFLHKEFADVVRVQCHNNDIEFVQIPAHNPKIDFLLQEYPDLYKKQSEYLFKSRITAQSVTDLCNALEEFSIRVDMLGASDTKRLSFLHSAFVTVVEDLTQYIAAQRDLAFGDGIYNWTIELYKKWKNQTDGISPTERSKKFVQDFKNNKVSK